MKKNLIVSGIVFVLLMVGFSGCYEQPSVNDFVGNWIGNSIIYEEGVKNAEYVSDEYWCAILKEMTFKNDGTGTSRIEIEGNYLDGMGDGVLEFYYSINGNKLVYDYIDSDLDSDKYTYRFDNSNGQQVLFLYSEGLEYFRGVKS